MPIATKHGGAATENEEHPPIKSYDLLIAWSYEVT